MEPKQTAPVGGIERAPVQAGAGYETASIKTEINPDGRLEQVKSSTPEVGGVRAEVAQIAMPAMPVPVLQSPADDSAAVASDDTPLIAGDDDLIEKEWVDKAKKILAETRDDPHLREREVSKLQIEYIRKRYGREIGDAGDE